MKQSTKYTIVAGTAAILWWFFRRRANQSQTNLYPNTLPQPAQNNPLVSNRVEKPDTTDQADLERPLVLLSIRDGVTPDGYSYKYQHGAFLIDNKKIIYMEVKGNNDVSINTFTQEVRISFEQEPIEQDRELEELFRESREGEGKQKKQEFLQPSIKGILEEHPDALIISFDYFGSTNGQVSIPDVKRILSESFQLHREEAQTHEVKRILYDSFPLHREEIQKYFELVDESSFYQAKLVVDPTSNNSAPHWYPCTHIKNPYIDVSTASGNGSVKAELRYRGTIVDGPESAAKGGSETISLTNTGQGTYELRVQGTTTGKYKVSGTWNCGYDNAAPVSNRSGSAG